MMFSDQCVFCQGKMFRKDEELLLRGGDNVATITVPADVCLRCGNQLLDSQTVRKIGEIEKKLASGQTEDFQCRGQHFQVVNSGLPLTGITARPNPPPFGRGRVVIPEHLQARAGQQEVD
jgi:YgiT-type zinc finger domain-containing protein